MAIDTNKTKDSLFGGLAKPEKPLVPPKEEQIQEKTPKSEESTAKPKKQVVAAVRISPQISCTVTQEDKEKLNELTLFLSNKKGKVLNTSTVIRSLIAIGEKYKEELEI